MEINWIVIVVIGILAIFLIVFLIRQNLMDEQDLENYLNKNEQEVYKEESELNDER